MAYSVSFSGRQGAIVYVIGANTISLPMTEWNATRSTDAIDGTNFTSRYPNDLGPWNHFGVGTMFEVSGEGSVASQEVAPGFNKIAIEARGYPTCETGVPGGSSVVPLPVIGQRVEFRLYAVVDNADIGTNEEQYYCRINSVAYNLNVRGVLEYSISATTAGPPPGAQAMQAPLQAFGDNEETPKKRYVKRRDAHVVPWNPPESNINRFARPKNPVPTPTPVPTPEEV